MPAYVPLAGYVVVRLTAELCVGVFNMCTIEHIPKEDLTVPADTLFAEGTRNKPDIAADILEHQAGAKPMHEPKSEEDGKKRKVALYVAYIGAGYAGMQINPGVTTIEGVLEAAIHNAGGISKDNAGDPSKVKWMRSARTDKGVSAVGQVVSLKMLLVPGVVRGINSALPPAITVFGYTRVTGSFDARLNCDKRRYEYILPEFAFDSEGRTKSAEEQPGPSPSTREQEVCEASLAPHDADPNTASQGENLAERSKLFATTSHQRSDGSTHEGDQTCFQFGEQHLQRLNAVLKAYEGTHNFHNFTPKMTGNDPTAKRYIISFSSPGKFTIRGETWVRLIVTGQSFMLHQIRKMVGVAVAIMRGLLPDNAIALALEPKRDIITPIAPDVGLFLDESIFDSYNSKWGYNRNECVTLENYKAEVEQFKEHQLYPQIAERDKRERCTAEWLQKLHENASEFQEWASIPLKDPVARDDSRMSKGAGKKSGMSKAERRQRKNPDSRPDTWYQEPKRQRISGAEGDKGGIGGGSEMATVGPETIAQTNLGDITSSGKTACFALEDQTPDKALSSLQQPVSQTAEGT